MIRSFMCYITITYILIFLAALQAMQEHFVGEQFFFFYKQLKPQKYFMKASKRNVRSFSQKCLQLFFSAIMGFIPSGFY